jgi:CRISPR-associated protein Cas1
MALLLLDRAGLDIRSEGSALALYEGDVRRGTVPLKLIDRCVIHGSRTRLDTGVLMKLAGAGVATVLIGSRQTRRAAIVLGAQHNDAAVRLAQSARVMDDAWCRQWALGTVRLKLLRQRRVLARLLVDRPDARKPLTDALQALASILQQLPVQPMQPGTGAQAGEAAPALPEVASLRGFEGAAASAYFSGLASVMPAALAFTGRKRRPPPDPVNACLSLGYTLVHAQAVQACAAAGLDPLLGFYHRPAFGHESLASDLIESLRPGVDRWVWEQFHSHALREDHFSLDGGACLLGKAGRAVFYDRWERANAPLRRWLRVQCQALARTLRSEGLPWLHQDDAQGESAWD